MASSTQADRYMSTYQKHYVSPALRQRGLMALTPRVDAQQPMSARTMPSGVPGLAANTFAMHTPRRAVPGFGVAPPQPGGGAGLGPQSARGPGAGGLAMAGGSLVGAKSNGAHTMNGATASRAPRSGNIKRAASLGVLRLDYDYPPAPGDIDSPESFGYDVFYRVVPGLTFEMCQSGKMTPAVEFEFIEAIKWLEDKQVTGITGDCGFMMYFQQLARRHTHKPVFMSALAQLPAITCAYNKHELIAILTANGKTLTPMRNLIKDECGVDPEEKRFLIVGCEDVPGFEAVALGEKVDVMRVTPGIVAKAQKILQDYPTVRAFLMECTELPPYSDAVRRATGLPVYDAITACDYFISGMQDNKRFGIQHWQEAWDGTQEKYYFGKHLTEEQRQDLVNKVHDEP